MGKVVLVQFANLKIAASAILTDRKEPKRAKHTLRGGFGTAAL
ncbi:MAG TPA: hypothetical protein VIO10_12470 [Candidatus Binatus sp.]